MKYTGKYKSMFSKQLNQDVNILEYKSENKFPYCDCDRCGKPIIKKMYVVQSAETDVEMLFLGSDCIKKFN